VPITAVFGQNLTAGSHYNYRGFIVSFMTTALSRILYPIMFFQVTTTKHSAQTRIPRLLYPTRRDKYTKIRLFW